MNLKHLKNLFQTRSQTLELVQDASSDRVSSTVNRSVQIRNIIGFWLLGLTNLYCFQILLSAAHDLLSKEFLHPTSRNTNITYPVLNEKSNISNNYSHIEKCNAMSTGAVLLAGIVPQILLKFILPFCYISPDFGIMMIALLLAGSFLLIGFSYAAWTTFLSIVGVAIPTCLGEIVLIRYSSIVYGKTEMIAWAAGIGGGAILSSLIYASFTTAGLSVRVTLHIMLVIPVLMLIAYWFILVRPKDPLNDLQLTSTKARLSMQSFNSIHSVNQPKLPIKFIKKNVTFKGNMDKIKMLMPYTLPLTLVFFAEFFINLGLYELIYFPGIWLKQSEQYRWFLTDYQVGVFVSRTFGTFFMFHNHWIIPLLQVLNIFIFMSEVFLKFIPSIWIMLILIFYEGILGGAAYVNIFAKLIDKIIPSEQEFSLSIVAIGDTLGIFFAGLLALPVHDYICNHYH